MEEGHPFIVSTGNGLVVNERDAGIRRVGELRLNAVGGKGDMVNAFAMLLEKLGDRAFRGGGLQQFQMDIAHLEKRGAHFLRLHHFRVFTGQAKAFFIVGDGFFQILNGDSEVIYLSDHVLRGLSAFERDTLCRKKLRGDSA